MKNDFSSIDIGEDFMAHYGVKGMRWGVRRDPETGVRPIAKALDESWFGRVANANANRYMRKKNTKAAARGDYGPHKSTSNNPDRKTVNRNAAIDAARAAGVNAPNQQRNQNLIKAGKAAVGVILLGYAGYQIHDAISTYRDRLGADRRLVDMASQTWRRDQLRDTAADARAASRYADQLKQLRDILGDS